MKKLCGEHVGSVAVLAQCKAAVRERRERTRREPRGGDLEGPLLIAPCRAKWPLAIQPPLPNRSSWRHILKKVDPGHIGSFRSGCRRRPRCCAPTARRVVGGSLETHRVTPRVRGGSRRRRRHRGAGQSRRRARIV